MRQKRHKIRMDRGDTLGGTVSLLLRDSVTPNGTRGRFLHRDRRDGIGWRFWGILLLVLLLASVTAWFFLPDLATNLGLPTAAEIGSRIDTFLSVPDA